MNGSDTSALPQSAAWADRLWRLFGTALSFACFGLGALVISCTLFPAIRLVSWEPRQRRRRIQRAMRQVMRLFMWLMKTLGVISYEVHGVERLRQPGQLVVANHPTLIDVVLMLSLMPEVDCIVKQALFRNPFLRWPVLWAGYIPNRDSQDLIEACARALREGRSLIVFPEGTRTVPGEPLTLRRGAAQIALAARCPVRPVGIVCTPLMLGKHQPWYWVPPAPGHLRLEVGAAIDARDFVNEHSNTLAARHLTRHLTEKFAPYAAAGGAVV